MTNVNNTIEMNVRVRTIRSKNPKGYGGCIFTGTEMNENGDIKNPKEFIVIRASSYILNGFNVEIGQWWHVEGQMKKSAIIVNGFHLNEIEITPQVMYLLRPSGKHIVSYLSENSEFKGIGDRKAERLWNKFGNRLFSILDKGLTDPLTTLLSAPMAKKLIKVWSEIGDSSTIRWLQTHNFTIKIGQRLIRYYGKSVRDKIKDDPYRLLSFCGNWKLVDKLALENFGLQPNDPRRLRGAVEEACYRLFDDGNTCASIYKINDRLRTLLGIQFQHKFPSLKSILESGESNGNFIITNSGTYHPIGAFIMEKYIAETVCRSLRCRKPIFPKSEVRSILENHSKKERIRLNYAQRQVIHFGNKYGFVVVTGGAGTGKTTVLRALHQIYKVANFNVHQVALSGRAAKRMHEATSHNSRTIAGFVENINEIDLASQNVVIIDEASMVDILSMYRLCRKFTNNTRIVMVGDPYQLPPIGPGLILHELAEPSKYSLFKNNPIPVVELTEVYRHGRIITNFARSIRYGEWPDEISDNTQRSIAFVRCDKTEINDIVCDLYQQDPNNTQILSATKNSPYGGSKILNRICQSQFSNIDDELHLWNEQFECKQTYGFRVNDPVICTRNQTDIDLQNGSLGRIYNVLDNMSNTSINECEDKALGQVLWDNGKVRDVTLSSLEDMELAYSITIHKSQGSEFPRIIVPIIKSRILDRTLIYTAITRAKEQCILVGDESVCEKAVKAPPFAHNRHVALSNMLDVLLEK